MSTHIVHIKWLFCVYYTVHLGCSKNYYIVYCFYLIQEWGTSQVTIMRNGCTREWFVLVLAFLMLLAKSAVHSQNANEETCSLLNNETLCVCSPVSKSSVIHVMLDIYTTNVQCSLHNSNYLTTNLH